MNIGVYPGSFDPITLGHVDIIKKAIKICDVVHVVIANNFDKKHMFKVEERVKFVIEAIKDIDIPSGKEIRVIHFEGIISLYAKKVNANIMIRGIRNHIDLDYEQNLEQFTKKTNPNLETIYFSTEPEHIFTSSSLVRNFIKTGFSEELEKYVSSGVNEKIKDFMNEGRFVKKFSDSFSICNIRGCFKKDEDK